MAPLLREIRYVCVARAQDRAILTEYTHAPVPAPAGPDFHAVVERILTAPGLRSVSRVSLAHEGLMYHIQQRDVSVCVAATSPDFPASLLFLQETEAFPGRCLFRGAWMRLWLE